MTTIERNYPFASCEALRCQIGTVEQRPAQIPVFSGREIIGHEVSAEMVPVFLLRGYGSTEARARARARRVSRNT